MEFGEMKRNTSNWSNFGMLLRRAGVTASAGLSCLFYSSLPFIQLKLACVFYCQHETKLGTYSVVNPKLQT